MSSRRHLTTLRLKPYNIFTEKEKDVYRIGVREAIRALQAWGWIVEKTKEGSASDEIMPASGDRSRSFSRRGGEDFDNNFDSDAPGGMNGYQPKPHNLESIALNRELNTVGEQLAENFHMIWAKRKKVELEEKDKLYRSLENEIDELNFSLRTKLEEIDIANKEILHLSSELEKFEIQNFQESSKTTDFSLVTRRGHRGFLNRHTF